MARAPQTPLTIHEARIEQVGTTDLERIAELAQEQNDAELEQLTKKAKLKETRLANLAKGREKKAAEKAAETQKKSA